MLRNRLVASLCVLLAIVSLCSLTRAEEPSAVEGEWRPTAIIVDGSPFKELDGSQLVIRGNELEYRFVFSGAPLVVSFDIVIDAARSPVTIDATPGVGRHAGKVHHGILEVRGDVLRLCLPDNPSTPRPTQFKSTPGSSLHLLEMARVKPQVEVADRPAPVENAAK